VTGDIAAAAGGCHIFSGCGYPAPGLNDFYFQKLFSIGGWNVTKPELIAVLCVIILVAFFWVAFAKPKMIPGKTQSIGELAVLAVRDQVVRTYRVAHDHEGLDRLAPFGVWNADNGSFGHGGVRA